jgi:hypothetical protein
MYVKLVLLGSVVFQVNLICNSEANSLYNFNLKLFHCMCID